MRGRNIVAAVLVAAFCFVTQLAASDMGLTVSAVLVLVALFVDLGQQNRVL